MIEMTRKGKRLIMRLLIAIAIVLFLAVALSYVLIEDQENPDNLEIPEKGFRGLF